MNVLRRINGIVHWCYEDLVIWSRGNRLHASEDGGQSISETTSLAVGPIDRLKSACRLSERLFRQGFNQAIELADNMIGLVGNRHLYHLNLKPFEIICALPFPSYRPFRMGWDSQHLVYGEYFNNPNRQPVQIWISEDQGAKWHNVYSFRGIRHIHSCQYDKFTKRFWIASGDLDGESYLRTTSDLFATVNTVAGGDQRFRVIEFVFEKDYVLYGTDTPLARNYLMRFDRQNQSAEPILEVGGSVFYLTKCQQGLVCSTSVEPSHVNTSRSCEVWFSHDGDRWTQIANFEKDKWSMHYFQFGRVQIPNGPGTKEGIWVSAIGTANDGRSLLLDAPESPDL